MEAEDSLYIQEHKLKRKVSRRRFDRAQNLRHSFTDAVLPSFPSTDDENLREAVWAEGLQHADGPSHRAEDPLHQHSFPRD